MTHTIPLIGRSWHRADLGPGHCSGTRVRCRMGGSRFGDANALSPNTMGGSHPLRRLWPRNLLQGYPVVRAGQGEGAASFPCSAPRVFSALGAPDGVRQVRCFSDREGSKSFVASIVARPIKPSGNMIVLTEPYVLGGQCFMKIRAAEGACGALHSFGLSR